MLPITLLKKLTINLLSLVNALFKNIKLGTLTLVDKVHLLVTNLFDMLTAPLTRNAKLKTWEAPFAGEVTPNSAPTQKFEKSKTGLFTEVKNL